MAYLNQINLIGYVGGEPKIIEFQNGKVANFTLATTRRWTNKDGEKEEQTIWHNIKCSASKANFVESYIKKGDLLYVTGELVSRNYVDSEDIERTAWEVRCENIQILNSKDSGQLQQQQQAPVASNFPRRAATPRQQYQTPTESLQPQGDDLPF